MYPVSNRYREAMSAPIRECKALARIYLGLFDATASPDAAIAASDAAFFSDPDAVNTDQQVEISYAAFEHEYFRLDGKQNLLPNSAAQILAQGWVSATQADANGVFLDPPQIDITFGMTHRLIGLTFTFGTTEEDMPQQITVLAYRNDQQIASKTLQVTDFVYRAELLLEDVDKLVLRYDQAHAPFGRARLAHLEFGMGYSYQNNEILEITEKHTDSPVALELPSGSLSFSLRNTDNRFGVDSDSALVRFFSEGQQVQVDYGIQTSGTEEWITGGIWYLSGWKIDGEKATFSAEDRIAQLTKTTYEKGVYDWEIHYMPEYAKNVLLDAGLTEDEFYLDPSISGFYASAPMPITSHAAALQLIANRSLARLYCARDGRVSLERLTIRPQFSLRPSSDIYSTDYSDDDSVLENDCSDYATFEPRYFRLDGGLRLLPDAAGEVPGSGLTSKEQSDADGIFDVGKQLVWHVKSDVPVNVFEVTLEFGGQIPRKIGICAKDENGWLPFFFFSPQKNKESFPVHFQRVLELQVNILESIMPYQRAHISGFSVSSISDFTLTQDQIFENPKIEMTERLRNVTADWIWRSFYPTITEEVASTKIMTNSDWTRIEHDCCFAPTAVVEESGIVVEQQHYAFVSYIRLSAAENKEVEVKIEGKKLYEVSYPIYSVGNDTGEDLPVESPLFDNKNIVQILDWIKDYYLKRVKRTVKVRGFPELECGDYIYLNDGKVAQIIGTELTYNGAFKETLTLRGD